LRNRVVILVDDGLATGATMRAAVQGIASARCGENCRSSTRWSPDTCREFEDEADETICASTPEFFQAVGQYYDDFSQTSDEEVRELLGRAAQERPAGQTGTNCSGSEDTV